jgi:hypothetical protein
VSRGVSEPVLQNQGRPVAPQLIMNTDTVVVSIRHVDHPIRRRRRSPGRLSASICEAVPSRKTSMGMGRPVAHPLRHRKISCPTYGDSECLESCDVARRHDVEDFMLKQAAVLVAGSYGCEIWGGFERTVRRICGGAGV